ncbi:hypothetical protein SAMN05216573_102104 [Bradyrhizobium sp. Rc3b]|nr:hypothetical protein SAMN05216573_102104 [Bradyrhizobium sp. Rc3b]
MVSNDANPLGDGATAGDGYVHFGEFPGEKHTPTGNTLSSPKKAG